MAGLADHLERLIAASGPISVARFMQDALADPEHGYYMRGDPLGAAGDFITAPEISQIFGELIGAWCAVVWQTMGEPSPLRLVELGPGRGTLMADALRAVAATAPGFHAALDIHLVETSPPLREAQRAALGTTSPTWHDTIATLPDGPALVVANEFFDALPVHQLVRTPGGWRERLVDAAPGGGFRFRLADDETPLGDRLPAALRELPEGSLVELRPAAADIAAALAGRLASQGGAALIVDYGHVRSAAGDTLQAVRGHRYADPLTAPGEADLTAHVDFQALGAAAAAAGARLHGPVTQAAFLTSLGIEARADALAAAAPGQAKNIRGRCQRLIGDAEMGILFKVLAIADPALPAPPGFET